MKHLKTLKTKKISATRCSCSYVKSMVNGGDLCLLNNVFLVSTSVVFVLIYVVLTEFESFSQDLTEMLLGLLSSIYFLYLPALCITVSRDQDQPTTDNLCYPLK